MATKDVIRFVQQSLKNSGYNPGPVDGVYGQKTFRALALIPGADTSFTKPRMLIAYVQRCAIEKQIECGPVDGYWGPQTEYAFEQLQYLAQNHSPLPQWRPDTHRTANPNSWPDASSEVTLLEFYGEPGTGQVMLELPFPMKLAWDTSTTVTRLQCHERVRSSLGNILADVSATYGISEISRLRLDRFGGCFNHRKMRGSDRLSMHSWGIALDFDPSRNKLRWGSEKAALAGQEYEPWWQAWESEGWVSLGRTRNFDWMHVQATA